MPSADELIDIAAIPKETMAWRPSYRIVVSRFPSAGLFDRVATPDELEALYFIESLTNPQLHQELGVLDAVAREDWRVGPGTSPIMAAFTHPSPSGSRWSDGTYGVYYCAKMLSTAIAETKYHQERFLHQNHVDEHLTVDMLLDNGYTELPITSKHTLAVGNLPTHYKDPFDCILIAQATEEGVTLLTVDSVVATYPRPIWRL
jgi:hypothetical protein